MTFGHLLKQGEDGTLLYERLGLEEVHGRGERRPGHLPPLHHVEPGVQLGLGGRQDHRAPGLTGGLQAHEGVPLGGVGGGTAHCCPQQAEEEEDEEAFFSSQWYHHHVPK